MNFPISGSINLVITEQTFSAFFAALASYNNRPQLDRIEAALKLLTQEQKQMVIDVTALLADVTAQTTVINGAVTLLNSQSATLASLSAQLAAAIAANDPAAIAAVQKSIDDAKALIDTNTAALASGVATNTPAQPVPDPAA